MTSKDQGSIPDRRNNSCKRPVVEGVGLSKGLRKELCGLNLEGEGWRYKAGKVVNC